MILTATISPLEPICSLEASDASARVVVAGGRSFLDGAFVLKLQGQASLPVRLSGAAGDVEVMPADGATWRVVAASRLVDIAFPQAAPYRAGAAGGPRLIAPSASLAGYGGTVWLVLRHVAISCLGGVDPAALPDSFVFPTKGAGGVARTRLKEWVGDGDSPYPSGFPVVADADGLWVVTGDRNGLTSFDHARVAAVRINSFALLRFRISDRAGADAAAVAFADARHAKGITVQTTPGSALRLTGRSFDQANGPLFAKRAVISGALMSVTGFDADEVTASYVDGGAELAALHGVQDQFRFLLPIPADGTSPAPPRAAQVVFVDERVAEGSAYTDHRQRFYGLRVGGLATTRTDQEVLDCTLATATLEGSAFAFRAGVGDLLSLLDGPDQRSQLVPKSQSNTRTLQAAAGRMRLGVDPAQPDLGFSTTATGGVLALTCARLQGPPVGSPARDPQSASSSQAYRDWILSRRDPFPLVVDRQGVRAAEPDWAKRFDAPTQSFALLEHPSAGFTYSSIPLPITRPRAGTAEPVQTGLQIRQVEGKELLVYTALVGGLSYVRIECGNFDIGKCFKTDDIKFKFKTIKDDGNLRNFVKGVASDDLRVILGGSADGIEELHRFIDANLGSPTSSGKIQYGHWPFASGLSILLRQDAPDGTPSYCDDIVRARPGGLEGAIAADFSATNCLPVEALFGTGTTWQSVASSAPVLWPRAGSATGIRLDPSFAQWNGIFFRNLPLIIVPAEGTVEQLKDKIPALAALYEKLNDSLLLEYGWHDEHGPTWLIKLRTSNELEFTPKNWESVIRLFLVSAESRGAQGATVGGGAEIRVELPCIQDDQQQSLTLRGQFDLDLTGQKPTTKITIRSESRAFASTTRVPGFSLVRVAALSTDFHSISFDLELVASQALVEAVPAFSSSANAPMKAVMTLSLAGDVNARVDLVLPQPIKSNLFGTFPISIEGLSLDLGSDQARLNVNCRVDLGLPGLKNWVLLVHATEKATAPYFDLSVELERISGGIDIGDLRLDGELTWLKKEFSGQLTLSGGIFGGSVPGLYARAGVEGDRPYWISALSAPRVGITAGASIEEPVLLLSHAMDYDGGKLFSALTQVSKPLNGLRPDGAVDQGWLQKWTFDAKVGTAFAGSGYLLFDERLAGSTKDKDDATGKYLTNLVITDDGRVRLDAWLNLMSQLPTRFVIAVDLKAQMMSAGMQLPAIKIPPNGSPKYEIAPGFVSLTIGYGSSPMVRYSVGWPAKVDGPGLERDWSRCTRVLVDGMVPINTFWGGIIAEYADQLSGGGAGVRLGIAVRAGWTKTYSAGGKGIAYAEADLGITLGGIFIFAFYRSRTTVTFGPGPSLLTKLTTAAALRRVVEEASSALETSLAPSIAALDFNACVKAEIYGDIWGRGSAEFMGITLASIDFHAYARFQICGDLNAGITSCWASVGFDVAVTIACVSYRAHAGTDIVLKDGTCPPACSNEGLAYARLPTLLPLLALEAH